MASRGIVVCAFDQRGWGRSVPNASGRGLTGPTAQVLKDIDSFLEAQLPTTAPLFLMGHSMGGAQVLHYAASGPSKTNSQISGYICESPFIALHEDSQPSRLVVIMGRAAAKLLPRRQMVQKLEPKYLCRDEELCREFEADELCHDTGTLEGLAGMLQRAEQLDRGQTSLDHRAGCSLWVGHGTEDRVTSFKATARFMERLTIEDKTFRVYDGYYHKLHAEPGEDKGIFANDVIDWILNRASRGHNDATNTSSDFQSKL
ncbi:MAG: hypothetical protein Q9222_003223 [Ikaeria aurantiellina]